MDIVNTESLPRSVEDLDKRRRAFVLAYVCGDRTRGKGAPSYRAAGYAAISVRGSAGGASRLLRHPAIKRAIQDLRAHLTEQASKRWILSAVERLQICAEIARNSDNSPRERISALRLDAELRGGFKQELETREIIVDLVVE